MQQYGGLPIMHGMEESFFGGINICKFTICINARRWTELSVSDIQGYSLNSTEMVKKALVRKLGCHVAFLKYLSIEWKSSV